LCRVPINVHKEFHHSAKEKRRIVIRELI